MISFLLSRFSLSCLIETPIKYLIVNRNLIELLAWWLGDRFIARGRTSLVYHRWKYERGTILWWDPAATFYSIHSRCHHLSAGQFTCSDGLSATAECQSTAMVYRSAWFLTNWTRQEKNRTTLQKELNLSATSVEMGLALIRIWNVIA